MGEKGVIYVLHGGGCGGVRLKGWETMGVASTGGVKPDNSG